MNKTLDPHTHRRSYTIEPRCKFSEAIESLVEYEMHPRNTVTFISEVDRYETGRRKSKLVALGRAGKFRLPAVGC